MIKRIIVILIAIPLLVNIATPTYACDEEQTKVYVQKILFGDNAFTPTEQNEMEKLLSALYLCSEQSNKDGQDKLNLLKIAKVGNVPSLEKINVNNAELYDCSHNTWEFISQIKTQAQEKRKDLLRKTVVNVFDFGWFNEVFNHNSGKIDSFSALLYYFHILADYLADDPIDTAISAHGYDIPSYTGITYVELNGNKPTFTSQQKKVTESYKEYSALDRYGRCGFGITNIGPDTLENISPRANIQNITPTGWEQRTYSDVMATNQLYDRCHLIAHQLGGADTLWNMVTGTRYLNEAMIEYETKVNVSSMGRHFLKKVPPQTPPQKLLNK